MTRLLTIEQASKILSVPKGSLRAAAEEHGFLVRIGRAIRINEDQLGDLVEKCKVPSVARANHQPKPVRYEEDETISIRHTKEAEESVKELKKMGRKR